MKSTRILEETNSIACATTCCRTSGSLGPEGTRSGLRTPLCEDSKFMPQSPGRTLRSQSKRETPYGVTSLRCADFHKIYSDAVLNLFFQAHGSSKKRTFKTDQIELAVVIEYTDFEIAETLWAEHKDREDGNASTIASTIPILTNPGQVVSH